MGDLKTTQDRRERFVAWLHMPGEDRYSIRAWCVAEDACDDVEVLLRENAKLRAVAEAAKAAVDMVDEEEPRDALRRALYALEAP